MFRIGEFSKLTQVSIRMLRYYDETGLLKPSKIDTVTNYRLYAPDQISHLNRIIFLRDLGFSVSEIAITLQHWDDAFLTKQLEDKRLEIESDIQTAQEKLRKLQMAKRDIQQGKIETHYDVSIKSIPSYQVFSLRRVVPNYYAEGLLWKELSAFAAENHIPISNHTFAIYHDSEYKETDVDIEICTPVHCLGNDTNGFTYRNTEPIPIMAYTMVHGDFKNIAGAYLGFASWLQEHNQYCMGKHTRQIVHRGPWNEENPDAYLIELQIPLNKR